MIVEVLSPSTELYDRHKKFQRYRTIESLEEYVLISQDEYCVETFSKGPSGWIIRETAVDPGSAVRFESLGVSIFLDSIYRRVSFELPAA